MIIDTHCHLYLPEFKEDVDNMLKRAVDAGIKQFFLPAIDGSTHTEMMEMEKKYPGKCFSMIGLHPCSVKENYLYELDHIKLLLEQRQFAAIGETGLDFYWDTQFTKEQYKALENQIVMALQFNLPIVLHTRSAMQETIDVIKQYRDTKLNGIFHCFGGTLQEARQIIDLGFYLGIGGVVTYKKSGLEETLKEIDLKHLVLETDAPYLSPVPFRGKRNESSYLTYIIAKIAEIKQVSIEEVARETTTNAVKIFEKSFK
ncbi:MAG: TatD family hydrolase [Chitinophagaceae bacterium]|nr:TatD family hydrolase [Chitinophagaceae bacterium]